MICNAASSSAGRFASKTGGPTEGEASGQNIVSITSPEMPPPHEVDNKKRENPLEFTWGERRVRCFIVRHHYTTFHKKPIRPKMPDQAWNTPMRQRNQKGRSDLQGMASEYLLGGLGFKGVELCFEGLEIGCPCQKAVAGSQVDDCGLPGAFGKVGNFLDIYRNGRV